MDSLSLIGEGNRKVGSPVVSSSVVNYNDNFKGPQFKVTTNFGWNLPTNERLKL